MEYLITVIVPSYNHEKYILECLDSIHRQTYRNFQWIVVDDGSTDNSPKILKANQNVYGYHLILQENKGLASTLTDVICNFSKGEYIALCASDDSWMPNKLEAQVDFVRQHPLYGMCFCRTNYMDVYSNKISYVDKQPYRGGGDIFEDIITQKFHPPVGSLRKKEVLKELGYFKTNIIAEDFYINCHIANKYQIGFVDECLVNYRVDNLEKKRDPKSLCDCHRNTIELFKSHSIYETAVFLSDQRTALCLSPYIKYKLEALKLVLNSPKLLFSKYYLLRFSYHLLFSWRKIKCMSKNRSIRK